MNKLVQKISTADHTSSIANLKDKTQALSYDNNVAGITGPSGGFLSGKKKALTWDAQGNVTIDGNVKFGGSDLQTTIDGKQPVGDYVITPTFNTYKKNNLEVLKQFQVKGDYALKDDLTKYQAKGDYALAPDLAKYQVKGDYALAPDLAKYQAKGDYALAAELAKYQAKGDYVLKGDIPKAESMANYALASELAKYQAKGDYALAPELAKYQAKGDYALAAELAKYQAKGDYALKADIPKNSGGLNYANQVDFVLGSTADAGRGPVGHARALVRDGGSALTINYAGDYTGGVNVGGPHLSLGGNLILPSGKSISIRDQFHGMSWKESVDGPSVYGYGGGALGTSQQDDKGGYKQALKWNRTGDVSIAGNVIMDGDNSWILHTPDDGRKNLYIAPLRADKKDWDWSKQTQLMADGSVIIPSTGLRVADDADWMRIYGSGKHGTAMYNSVSIKDGGGLNVGEWLRVPEGMIKSNALNIRGQGHLQFGDGFVREGNAGQISYGAHDGGAGGTLNIVGAGKDGQSRMTNVWESLRAGQALGVGDMPRDWTGVNIKNRDGRWTHFDWKQDGKNYIRGDTIVDGAMNVNGAFTVNGKALEAGGGGGGTPGVKFIQNWGGDATKTESQIANDTQNYKALMITGNRSNDNGRRNVQVWDDLNVPAGNVKINGQLCIGPDDNNWCFTPNANKQWLDIRRNGAVGDKADTGEFHLSHDGNIFVNRSTMQGWVSDNLGDIRRNAVRTDKRYAIQTNPENVPAFLTTYARDPGDGKDPRQGYQTRKGVDGDWGKFQFIQQ